MTSSHVNLEDLEAAAVARPGDTVFLQAPSTITPAQAIALRESADKTAQRAGIHIIFLPSDITVARITNDG
jgi:hypothetical protein